MLNFYDSLIDMIKISEDIRVINSQMTKIKDIDEKKTQGDLNEIQKSYKNIDNDMIE